MKRTNTAVWMEKQKRWQIKVQKDGIRKTFYSGTPGRTGQRECNAKADAWLDDGVEHPNAKISKLSAEFVDSLSLTGSKSYIVQYSYFSRVYLNKRIGNVRISDLHEQHLQDVINYGYSKGLSKKTLQGLRTFLSSFVKYCRKCKYTKLYPEDLKIPTGAPTHEKTVLQPDELRKLFNTDTTKYYSKTIPEQYINAYRFECATGTRPGETLGLKWTDIFRERVTLQRSYNYYGEFTTGKNDNAHRVFDLNPVAAAVIENQRKMQEEQGIVSEYVFTDELGDNIGQRSYYKHWKRYCKSNGIDNANTPYELRHTFVSVVKTIPEGYLKSLVGHSKDMDTYGVYSHEYSDDIKEAANLVGEIFGKILGA